MFGPPPPSPFFDADGSALAAAFGCDEGLLARGIIGAMCPRAIMAEVEFLDGSLVGVVAFQAEGKGWRPLLKWSKEHERWEPVVGGVLCQVVLEPYEPEPDFSADPDDETDED